MGTFNCRSQNLQSLASLPAVENIGSLLISCFNSTWAMGQRLEILPPSSPGYTISKRRMRKEARRQEATTMPPQTAGYAVLTLDVLLHLHATHSQAISLGSRNTSMY